MKNILMTGGTGFLGSRLLKKLARRYHVIVLKRSFSDLARLKPVLDGADACNVKLYDIDKISISKIFKKEKVDIVLHCATHYGRGHQDPAKVLFSNLMMPLELLELCRKFGVSTFINTDTILDKEISHYSLSKSNFKEWLKVYSDYMICVNIASAHFYGPQDDKTKFISFLIDGMMRNVKEIDLTLGEQRRDFIYIDDVVNGFLVILKSLKKMKKGYHHFEIGTGVKTKIKNVALLIKDLTGNTRTQLNFGALPYRKNEIMEAVIDTMPLKRFGWKYKHELSEGLLSTIQQEKKFLVQGSKD